MVYRMVYESEKNGQLRTHRGRRMILTVFMFIVFYTAVCTFWPQGKELLQMLLIPGDPEIILQAAEVFAAEISSGYTVLDAARNFFGTVWKHGFSG